MHIEIAIRLAVGIFWGDFFGFFFPVVKKKDPCIYKMAPYPTMTRVDVSSSSNIYCKNSFHVILLSSNS